MTVREKVFIDDVKINRQIIPVRLDILMQVAAIQFGKKRPAKTEEVKLPDMKKPAIYRYFGIMMDEGLLYRPKMGKFEVTNDGVTVLNEMFFKLAPIYGVVIG